MAKKIYKKFSEIETLLKNSKHAKLQDVNHKDIVPFNQPKKPIKPKVLEIKKKLEQLPDGIYCVVAQDRFGAGVHQDRYYFGKGRYENVELEEDDIPPSRSRRNNSSGGGEHLLSLDNAVDNIREASELKADNRMLTKENTKLTEEVDSLKKKLKEQEELVKTLQDANAELSEQVDEEPEQNILSGLAPFLSELVPVIPSLADRWFNLKEKENDTRRAELLVKNGYDLPGMKKKVNGHAPAKKRAMPQPGTAEWEQYVEEVKELDDDKFNEHLALIEEKFPSLYPYLYADVMDEEGEEEEEEETE